MNSIMKNEGYWKAVIWDDCLNPYNGLPALEDNYIDLCSTDPPYNVNYGGIKRKGKAVPTVVYTDRWTKVDYESWCREWFKEVMRVCNGLVFTPGNPNVHMWHTIREPDYVSKIAYCPDKGIGFHYETIMFYGKVEGYRFLRDVIVHRRSSPQGFLNPSPKAFQLWEYLIRKLKS